MSHQINKNSVCWTVKYIILPTYLSGLWQTVVQCCLWTAWKGMTWFLHCFLQSQINKPENITTAGFPWMNMIKKEKLEHRHTWWERTS